MKKPCSILMIFFLSLVFVGCNPSNQAIKKDLNSRFTKFEIVEIRKDSSNVYDAMMTNLSLRIRIADNNLGIIKSINDIEFGTANKKPYQTILYIDSLFNNSVQGGTDLENKQFDKRESCYYVKYLIHKEERKITKEEYFYINEINGEVLHRPYDWSEFLRELKYSDQIKDALLYQSEIMDLKRKFKFDSLKL